MSIRRCQQSPSWNGDETDKPPHKRLVPKVTGTFMPPDLVAIFKHVRNHVIHCQQPQSWNEEVNKILTQTLDVWSRSLNFIKFCYCSTNRQIDKRLTITLPRFTRSTIYSKGMTFEFHPNIKFSSHHFWPAMLMLSLSRSGPNKETNTSLKAIKFSLANLLGLWGCIRLFFLNLYS